MSRENSKTVTSSRLEESRCLTSNPALLKGFSECSAIGGLIYRGTCILNQPWFNHSYPSVPNVPRAAPSHTWDPITRPSPRSLSQDAIARSQGRRGEDGDDDAAPHAAHDKAVNVEKLGFFKRADEKREGGKDQEAGWEQKKGRVADEL